MSRTSPGICGEVLESLRNDNYKQDKLGVEVTTRQIEKCLELEKAQEAIYSNSSPMWIVDPMIIDAEELKNIVPGKIIKLYHPNQFRNSLMRGF